MVNSDTIEIDGIGPVLFERSKRAKNLNISVKPFTGIRVAVPYGLSFKKAVEFVYTKIDWIQRHLKRMQQYEQEYKIVSGTYIDIDKTKAKRRIKRRLKHLAGKYGFTYNRVFIRNQKTRWGSCSRRNNISLNMKIIRLPEALMDYVILHELVHTRKKGHNSDFWAEVDKIVRNRKEMVLSLKEYGIGVL
ncbi:M48 family metallopeptidase [Chloroflexota bacterium]